MWLFSKVGFVSVVAHRDEPGMLLVRGRFAEDIDTVRELLAGVGETVKSFQDRHADYRYRLVCPKTAFAKVVSDLISHIDYDNFKNAVHGNPTRDRAYMKCWAAMNEAQGWGDDGEQ